MKIETSRTNDTLTLFLSGRLDGTHAPELESAIAQSMEDLPQLVIHCADLEYVSSAGLRVLLTTFKKLGSSRMRLTEVPRDVFDILDMTGFSK